MSSHSFTFNGEHLVACAAGALWGPDRRILCVSDLHLGKSERIARRGGALLPPYDTAATLLRLRAEVEDLSPKTVISLGDSFDDQDAEMGLMPADARMLVAMMAGRRWIWIAGNHDPGPVETGGTWVSVFQAGPLTFRHIAERKCEAGEISGHYHPKMKLHAKGARVTRPCFLCDAHRMILPSFGAYTGGLHIDHPQLQSLFGAEAFAFMIGQKVIAVPAQMGFANEALRA